MTVAVLEVVPVLAVAETVNEPLPVLLAGVTLVMVSHVWLLVGVFQVTLDVTETVSFEAADGGDHVSGLIVKVAATGHATEIT